MKTVLSVQRVPCRLKAAAGTANTAAEMCGTSGKKCPCGGA